MQDDLVKGRTCGLLAATATAALFLGAQPVSAQTSGPTATGDNLCMQEVYGEGERVTPANRLNCTASDVRLARAVEVFPDRCIAGSEFTLTATFEIVVGASERYDTGFFFRIDGGDDARDPAGTCSLSALDLSGNPGVDLDGDTCGDLSSGTHFATFTIPGVECEGVPDPDNPGQLILQLPNCTSWHSNRSTACSLPIGDGSGFRPETKSKCVCDDTFTVPVVVETASITVVKQAAPETVSELGGTVTYTVQVTNDSEFQIVTITTIFDDIYGNLLDATNTDVFENTCPDLDGVELGAQGSGTETAICGFKAFVDGNAGELVTDVAVVCGDQEITNDEVCDDDDATVTITDVHTEPDLTKTALTAGCTVDTTYQVVVTNNSEVDFLTVDDLTDDPFGDITEVQDKIISTDCERDVIIDPLGNYTCSFVGRLTSENCSIDKTDTVTGTVTDDDGIISRPSDSATVKVDATFP